MLDMTQGRPWHLKTWPRANLRAKVIYNTAWTLGRFGVHLPNRLERYHVAPGSLYAQLQDQFEHLGIFLGTPGPNRKFVLYAGREDVSYFIKVPLSPVSSALVDREAAALADVATDPDLAPLIPQARRIAGKLALKNIEGKGARYDPLPLKELVRIHDMLFRRSKTTRPLALLRADWHAEMPEGKLVEHPQETQDVLKTAQDAANYALNTLPQNLEIPCYMAHGDFTRWNVLRGADGRARIIDWELYGVKPKWFDVLHYMVSHELLVSRIPVEKVMTRLSEVGKEIAPEAEAIWWKQVTLYFAYQCLYYTCVYKRQPDLGDYPQAMWQLHSWLSILTGLAAKLEGHWHAEMVDV